MFEVINRPIIRLLMVGLPLLAVQTTLLTEVRISDTVVQLMLLLAVVGGVAGGPERGALVGFAFGLLVDLAFPAHPLGLTAFVYGLTGFLAGYINSLTADHPWWLTMLVTAVASALGTVLYPVAATMVGIDGLVDTSIVRVCIVVGVVNGVLAPLFLPLMRWCLLIKKGSIVLPPIDVVNL